MVKIGQDTNYIYNITNSTLDIYSYGTQEKGAYLNSTCGFNNLYVEEDNVYIGTTTSGVLYLDKDDIVFDTSIPTDLTSYARIYKQYPDITSDKIIDIHGEGGCISFCTSSGVDFFKIDPNGYRSYTTVSGVGDSFIYSQREFYYTVDAGDVWYIYQVDPITNWGIANFVTSTNNEKISRITEIKGLKVTKNSSDQIILFLLTDVGICVFNVDENESIYIS